MARLSVEALCVSFGSVNVLANFTLTVAAGERHTLIGPNGAGKTTLLSAISGWIKPQCGVIHFENQPLIGRSPQQIAQLGVARANQIPHGFPTLTVFEHLKASVSHAQRWFRFPNALQTKIEALLQQLNLDDAMGLTASQLSHGQRKRLELGCALALDPRLLLLDEPTAGLSPAESDAMVALLKTIPVTMLIVEHDMDVVAALADRVSVLHEGRLLAQGAPNQIAENAEVQKVYLGHATS